MGDLRRHIPPVALSWDDEARGQRWRSLPGTLVFADISGFTALTERLAARGRIGAEEIVEILNRIFGGMLDTAAARGGELLKFGGDALLFLFRGPDHAQEACDAAVEMRASLRTAAEIPTAVGRLKLSMSVGIHSGDVDLFLVGEPTRELIVLGPAATAVAGAEKAADAGQILVTPGTAAALHPRDTRPGPDGLLLLRRRKARSEAPGPQPTPEARAERLASLIPHTLAFHVTGEIPEPEHRTACMAFIRFSGTDGLLAQDGPEAVAEAAHTTVTAVNRAVAAEDVTLLTTDLDSDGGKFFLGAGLIRGTEDDEGRMLRAVRAVMDSGAPLPLQAGVNRGHVFAAEIGTARRASYTGMGDTTNTAARIMAKAPVGHLFAHPAVVERSRTLFATTPAGPFTMKGKAEPLLVFDIGEEIGTRETGANARLPFLGREAELTTVRSAVVAAVSGRGGTVTITGPTGIGKTRLAHESIESAAGAKVVTVHAEPYGISSAYRVFRDPLRDLLGVERSDPISMGVQLLQRLTTDAPGLVPLAPLLADVIAAEVPETPESAAIDPQFRPQRRAEVVVEVLSLLVPSPLIILADGMQWADAASADLLQRIARATADRPWALLVVRRDEGGGFRPATGERVALEPLDRGTIESLIDAATEGNPLRPHEAAAIADRAQGNPLFVEEVTRVVRPGGSLDSLPDSVQSALNAQIDQLDPHARRILRYCSVLGRSFRGRVAAATLAEFGLHVDSATLSDLRAFVEPLGSDRLRFRNNLVRDTAYDGLAYRIRARVHAAAGAVTERLSSDLDADSATLSLHYWRAGDNAKTWEYACRAGALARRTYANADAAAHYDRALEAGRRLPEVSDEARARMWSVLGEVRELAGLLDESVAAYRRAEALVDHGFQRAGLVLRRARVQERAGQYRGAIRAVGEARRLVSGTDDPEARRVRVRLEALTALIRLGQQRPAEAKEWAQRAAAGARTTDDPETLVQALMAIDHSDLFMGSPPSGEPTREALEICQVHRDEPGFRPRLSIALSNLGVYAFYAGRWDEAVAKYEESRRVARDAGNEFGAAETELSLGEILIGQGEVDEAEKMLTRAVRVLDASGMTVEAAYGRLQLARAALARADRLLRTRPASEDQSGIATERAEGTAGRAAAPVDGPLSQIRELLASAAETSGQVALTLSREHAISALEAELVRAEAITKMGEPDEALHLIEKAERAAGEDGAPLRAKLHLERARAYAALGRRRDCEGQVIAGLQAAEESDLPYERALLLLVRADWADRHGTPESASHDRLAARAILDRLGVTL